MSKLRWLSRNWWQRLKLLLNLPRSLWLSWKIIQDNRVSMNAKLQFIGLALGYLLLPFDLVIDTWPIIGQIDDLAVIVFLINRFLSSVPEQIIREYLAVVRR